MPSAQRVNWAKFRVAVMTAVATLITGSLIYMLVGGALAVERVTVYLYTPDATGLAPGLPVRVDGITVGKISSVALSGSRDPNRIIKLSLAIERRHLRDIPADSVAQISSETMVGDLYVDISSGKSAQRLRPGGEVAYQAPSDLLKSLDLTQFKQRLDAIGSLLTDLEQGRTRVGRFVAGEDTYRDLQKKLADAEESLIEARQTTGAVGRIFNTDELYRGIIEPVRRLDEALEKLQAGQGGAGEFLTKDTRYENMLAIARNLHESIAKARQGELLASDELYNRLNQRAAALIQTVDEMNAGPMFSTTQLYDNMNGAARQMRDTLRDFRTDPRKFLRMGVF